MNCSVRELRAATKRILGAVGRGTPVTITYRSKPYARILPVAPPTTRGTAKPEAEAFGMWRDHAAVADVDAYVRNLRRGRTA